MQEPCVRAKFKQRDAFIALRPQGVVSLTWTKKMAIPAKSAKTNPNPIVNDLLLELEAWIELQREIDGLKNIADEYPTASSSLTSRRRKRNR